MDTVINIPDIANTLQIRDFHIRVVEPGWTYHNHYHHSFELLYCWDGSVTQSLNGESILFKKGDWLLIPSGMRHKTSNGSNSYFTYISLMFNIDDPDFRRELKQFSKVLITSEEALGTQLTTLISELDALVHKYKIHSASNNATIKLPITDKLDIQACILLMIKSVILILEQSAHISTVKKTVSSYEVDTAYHIEQLILAYLCNPELSVSHIAKRLGMSRIHCTKLFSNIYGVSPRQYITSQRLLLAKERLINTHLSIESIAEEIGFSSLSHFSRQFKRWIGVSPLNYRPKHST